MNSSESVVQTPTLKSTSSSTLSGDELVYQQISADVLSIQLIQQAYSLPHFQMIACTSSGAPHLLELQSSLHVHSLGPLASDIIGEYSARLSLNRLMS